MGDTYIYDAVRTPRGKGKPASDNYPGGALSTLSPQALISCLVDAIDDRLGACVVDSASQLILGCVGQVGAQGGHIALISKLASKINNRAGAKTINNYCASGLTAVNEAAARVQAGLEDGLVFAGGVEMLSRVPFLADEAAFYNDPDVMTELEYFPPIMGAELMATLEGFEKKDLDELSVRSHRRAHTAWEEGRYDSSVVTVSDHDGNVLLARDEWIRPDISMDALDAMEPAFAMLSASGKGAIMLKHFPELSAISHVHSVANTPGMSDAAALVIVGSKHAGEAAHLKPKARIRSIAEVGGDPILQFGAGFEAMELAMNKANVSIHDFDRIEFMEAFAAPPLKFERTYQPNMDRVNVNGGHIAMGHPMGATGAILTTTLVHELERSDGELGLVVALAANGIGSALVIERV